MKLSTSVILLSYLLASCVIHVGPGGYRNPDANPDNIFGDIQVASGQEVQNVYSVNGSIELSHRATAMKVETVNGNIEIGDWVRVAQIITVNGNVRIGENFKADDKIATTNGNIRVAQNAKIRGNLQTINGNIVLDSVLIDGVLFNMNGDTELLGKSKLTGDLVYKSNAEHDETRLGRDPILSIAEEVVIAGSIILERPVQLRLANPNTLQKVVRKYELKQP